MDLTGVNDDFLGAFGEAVTVDPTGQAAALIGALREPWSGITMEGLPVERQDYELLMRQTDWDPLGLAEGTDVEIGGQTYTVTNVQPEQSGVVALTLRRY